MSAENPFLYKRGNEYVKKTGGWVQYPWTGHSTSAMQLQAYRIYADKPDNVFRAYTVGTNGAVDFRGWSRLHIVYRRQGTASDPSYYDRYFIRVLYEKNWSGTVLAQAHLDESATEVDVSVNVSNIDEGYICVMCEPEGSWPSPSQPPYIDIREVYLT